jgi:hypothetical protein
MKPESVEKRTDIENEPMSGKNSGTTLRPDFSNATIFYSELTVFSRYYFLYILFSIRHSSYDRITRIRKIGLLSNRSLWIYRNT